MYIKCVQNHKDTFAHIHSLLIWNGMLIKAGAHEHDSVAKLNIRSTLCMNGWMMI